MGITSANKELNVTQIEPGGTAQVRLSLTAVPNVTSDPTDIVLILNRSESMAGDPLTTIQSTAKAIIDRIQASTNPDDPTQIGADSRMAVVSFADTAVANTTLITSVADLKAAVDGLTPGGLANHADALTTAQALFDPATSRVEFIILLSDGINTAGTEPNTIATALKAAGTRIYSIGEPGAEGIGEQALRDWASNPDSVHVAISPDAARLEEMFGDLIPTVTQPGATGIVVTDAVSDCFRIISMSSPTKGTAIMNSAQTVTWQIPELGTAAEESASFEFTVEHVGPCTGTVEVNQDISYDDAQGGTVTFPSPTLYVNGDVTICEGSCRDAVDLSVSGCSESIELDAGDIYLDGLGRIVQLDVTLRNVCPQKRVALAVLLNEVDADGVEYKRGMKTMTIPAHTQEGCRDVTIRCLTFVLPEDLNVSGTAATLCGTRNFRARFIAHYIDNDVNCCPCEDTNG
jgi:hypothetical protein